MRARNKRITIVSYDIRFSNGLTVSIDPKKNRVYTIENNPYDQTPSIKGPITIEQLLDYLKEIRTNAE